MRSRFEFGFYGDDFTGSTDAMEALSLRGMPTLLFLDVPDEKALASAAGYSAIGIAGTTRAMNRVALGSEVRRVFKWCGKQGFEAFHYKVCSTLDSSPEHGNIGTAIDAGQELFHTRWVPLVIGAPFLRRWVAFANLFAIDGDAIHRIDRHPTMSRHPVTPMDESDIRRHLAKQTDNSFAALTIVDLHAGPAARHERLDALTPLDSSGVIVFDTIDDDDLAACGELLHHHTKRHGPFIVGSSGVEAAWANAAHAARAREAAPQVRAPVSPLLVISGSASPKTRGQIAYARQCGWTILSMEPWRWFAGGESKSIDDIVGQTVALLREERDVVLTVCEGPDDPAIARTLEAAQNAGLTDPLQHIGATQGKVLRRILEEAPLSRVCVCGGDTSGHVTRALGIHALEYAASLDPGGPLCIARAPNRFDGIEISLKGGQVGTPDYFLSVKNGRKAPIQKTTS
jgi:uncharacterized protein YgbK (DUF1537 family)